MIRINVINQQGPFTKRKDEIFSGTSPATFQSSDFEQVQMKTSGVVQDKLNSEMRYWQNTIKGNLHKTLTTSASEFHDICTLTGRFSRWSGNCYFSLRAEILEKKNADSNFSARYHCRFLPAIRNGRHIYQPQLWISTPHPLPCRMVFLVPQKTVKHTTFGG